MRAESPEDRAQQMALFIEYSKAQHEGFLGSFNDFAEQNGADPKLKAVESPLSVHRNFCEDVVEKDRDSDKVCH